MVVEAAAEAAAALSTPTSANTWSWLHRRYSSDVSSPSNNNDNIEQHLPDVRPMFPPRRELVPPRVSRHPCVLQCCFAIHTAPALGRALPLGLARQPSAPPSAIRLGIVP